MSMIIIGIALVFNEAYLLVALLCGFVDLFSLFVQFGSAQAWNVIAHHRIISNAIV